MGFHPVCVVDHFNVLKTTIPWNTSTFMVHHLKAVQIYLENPCMLTGLLSFFFLSKKKNMVSIGTSAS